MKKVTSPSLACSKCGAVWQKNGATNCWSEPESQPPIPSDCPTELHADTIADSLQQYTGESRDAVMARTAAVVEGLSYRTEEGRESRSARWTRVEDILFFAKRMGYRKIGIATCIGLLEETRRLAEILSAQELEPCSICCKAGRIDKLDLGLCEQDKVRPGTFEPACNPIAQARILNQAGTDMNIIMGLCIGHDMLFTKHSEAPVTTLVVKDRVTGHNPATVLYGQNFYYRRLVKEHVHEPVPAANNADNTGDVHS